MSARLADSAGRLPAWRMGVGNEARSLLAKSGSPRDESVRLADWQPDIRFSHAPQLTIDPESVRELTNTTLFHRNLKKTLTPFGAFN